MNNYELEKRDKEILKNLKGYLNLLISEGKDKIIFNELNYDEKIIDCINVLENIIGDSNYLTFEKLSNIIEKYNIPKDVHLMSDSGWECNATEMNGILYNEKENIIVFKQDIEYLEEYYNNWKILK